MLSGQCSQVHCMCMPHGWQGKQYTFCQHDRSSTLLALPRSLAYVCLAQKAGHQKSIPEADSVREYANACGLSEEQVTQLEAHLKQAPPEGMPVHADCGCIEDERQQQCQEEVGFYVLYQTAAWSCYTKHCLCCVHFQHMQDVQRLSSKNNSRLVDIKACYNAFSVMSSCRRCDDQSQKQA